MDIQQKINDLKVEIYRFSLEHEGIYNFIVFQDGLRIKNPANKSALYSPDRWEYFRRVSRMDLILKHLKINQHSNFIGALIRSNNRDLLEIPYILYKLEDIEDMVENLKNSIQVLKEYKGDSSEDSYFMPENQSKSLSKLASDIQNIESTINTYMNIPDEHIKHQDVSSYGDRIDDLHKELDEICNIVIMAGKNSQAYLDGIAAKSEKSAASADDERENSPWVIADRQKTSTWIIANKINNTRIEGMLQRLGWIKDQFLHHNKIYEAYKDLKGKVNAYHALRVDGSKILNILGDLLTGVTTYMD